MPAGSLANASSVGAKTVNGPGPLSVSTRPGGLQRGASVLNEPAHGGVDDVLVHGYYPRRIQAVPAGTVVARLLARPAPRRGLAADRIAGVGALAPGRAGGRRSP